MIIGINTSLTQLEELLDRKIELVAKIVKELKDKMVSERANYV
jgi:hypothetical protein